MAPFGREKSVLCLEHQALLSASAAGYSGVVSALNVRQTGARPTGAVAAASSLTHRRGTPSRVVGRRASLWPRSIRLFLVPGRLCACHEDGGPRLPAHQ